MSASGRGILSKSLKDKVVSSTKKAGCAGIQPVTSAKWTAPGFADLPVHRELKLQQVATDVLGLENPYFRVHEARAGATASIAGRSLINFASYDYLGLNGHPQVAAAAVEAIETLGTSVSASRVVAGERPLHRQLERKIASLYQADDAVVFVSGHATNVTAVAALLGPDDLIVTDELAHNSMLVGAQLSGATRRSFAHNDPGALDRTLAETRGRHRHVLIAVEGLYSMDGDVPDLPRLIDIKRRYGAWLMVDEAHALGVLGRTGLGSAEHFGIGSGLIDIWMGTLSKTCASCGGFIAGAKALVEILKYTASGFVYSVGMPPSTAAAALAALEIMQQETWRVARLQENSRLFFELARASNLDAGHAQGHAIVSILIGDSLRAVKLAQVLFERGINALPIIPPAVPIQGARLRFFLSADHTEAHIRAAVSATREELERLRRENFGLSSLAAQART
jgi:8-amino-7-oxononanoate synthase